MKSIATSESGRAEYNNSNKSNPTIKEVQKHIIAAIIGAVFAASGISVYFYFNTNYSLKTHTIQLTTVDSRLDKNDAKVESIQTDLTIIKSQMTDVKESQSTTQQDIKKIYDILLAMKK